MSKREGREAYASLLDAWTPPPAAGTPIGCLTTTFTFSPALFEEECLTRFAGIEADPDEDGAIYLIEREEKLQALRCCAALVDAQHCRGRRSLRWDLLLARVLGGVQHAKVSMLCWQDSVRVILGSANLTEAAYRKNQEVFVTIDLHDGAETPFINPLGELAALFDFLRKIAGRVQGDAASPSLERWRGLIDWAEARCHAFRLTSGEKQGSMRFAFNLPGDSRVDEQVAKSANELGIIDTATVVSPFFDPPHSAADAPATWLWGLLRQRGDASIEFRACRMWDSETSEPIALQATADLDLATPPGRPGCETRFSVVNTIDVETPFGKHARALHAKQILLEGARACGVLAGSSNFTSAGLGLARGGGNIEANVFWVAPSRAAARRAIVPATDLVRGSYSLATAGLVDPESEEVTAPLLPVPFGAATLQREKDSFVLVLEIGAKAPVGFEVLLEEHELVLYDYTQWQNAGRPKNVLLPWKERALPSGLEVRWTESKGRRAWWPVNVAVGTVLPPPDELRSLTLDELIEVLTSTRRLQDAMRRILQRRARASVAHADGTPVDLDPHARVNTSGFLMQRARRFAWALNGLHARLVRPVATEEGLQWRLNGPIGCTAVWRATLSEAGSPDEAAFLAAELLLELEAVVPETAPGCLSSEDVRAAIQRWISAHTDELRSLRGSASSNMARYLDDVVGRMPKVVA